MMAEGAAGKQGLPVTHDPGRVLRPGDKGFAEATRTPPQSKTRRCVVCTSEYVPTGNAQKRCPKCSAKQKPPTKPQAAASPPVTGGGAASPLASTVTPRRPRPSPTPRSSPRCALAASPHRMPRECVPNAAIPALEALSAA